VKKLGFIPKICEITCASFVKDYLCSYRAVHYNEEDPNLSILYLPPEKCLKLKVSLTEMNRVLGVVMFQPR